jgi:hypothetical protein
MPGDAPEVMLDPPVDQDGKRRPPVRPGCQVSLSRRFLTRALKSSLSRPLKSSSRR